jgi:acyl-ACP thioesterase
MELMLFEKNYMVHVYETGPGGKLTLPSFFNFLQDIASDHAIKLGFGRDALLRDKRFWVLSRIYAEIKDLPQLGDNLIIRTWPNGTDKLFALRNFDLSLSDGTHLASATSSWLILDMETHKVQRPDAILSQFYSDLNPSASPIRYATKLEFDHGDGGSPVPHKIKVSDLDINLHTNNVSYLKWVYDCYDLDFIMKYTPRSAEINYLAESQFGEEVKISVSGKPEEEAGVSHSITRTGDGRELCRIRICWDTDRNG